MLYTNKVSLPWRQVETCHPPVLFFPHTYSSSELIQMLRQQPTAGILQFPTLWPPPEGGQGFRLCSDICPFARSFPQQPAGSACGSSIPWRSEHGPPGRTDLTPPPRAPAATGAASVTGTQRRPSRAQGASCWWRQFTPDLREEQRGRERGVRSGKGPALQQREQGWRAWGAPEAARRLQGSIPGSPLPGSKQWRKTLEAGGGGVTVTGAHSGAQRKPL